MNKPIAKLVIKKFQFEDFLDILMDNFYSVQVEKNDDETVYIRIYNMMPREREE